MAYGPIPDNLFVLHNCDNPPCVRPSHLKLGTHDDNMKDMTERNRQATGERNGGGVKVTDDEVRAMRAQFNAGTTTIKHLSILFGVSKSQAGRIVKRQSWKHIP